MRFKPWQWLILGGMACTWLVALVWFGMTVLNRSPISTGALAGATPPPQLTVMAVVTTPASTATPTPRPTRTRVVVPPTAVETSTPVPPTPRPDDYFPLAPGYYWIYQNNLAERIERTVKEMQIINAQVYYVVTEAVGAEGAPDSYRGEYRYMLQGSTVLLEHFTVLSGRATSYAYEPFQPILKMPLATWSPWTWAGRRFAGTQVTGLRVTWEAYPERVRLPIGDFEGYRVIATSTEETVVAWYAPGVGLIEQSVAGAPQRSFKLIEYWVGPTKP